MTEYDRDWDFQGKTPAQREDSLRTIKYAIYTALIVALSVAIIKYPIPLIKAFQELLP